MEATLEVIAREGLTGLTTRKVATVAGLSQPSFYLHFASMDDAIDTAGEMLGREIYGLASQTRTHAGMGVGSGNALKAYATTVSVFASDHRLVELFLRYRLNNDRFGQALRRFEQHIRRDVADDLRRLGLDENAAPSFELLVDLSIGTALTIVMGVKEGRYDIDAACDALARVGPRMIAALMADAFDEMTDRAGRSVGRDLSWSSQ